ncbi:MAG: hypothetical protein KDC05_01930 [Bacteroidales bacterium]|nr:hypothetical protein [Bacteroidales bacterium]
MKVTSSGVLYPIFLLITAILIISSCRKDDIIDSNPAYKLTFSTDTIIFDTVFTTIGSTTRALKIYNRNNSRVNISRIYVSGGSSSNFEVNINGIPASSLNNIELAADDSLYIFVRVNVDPTNSNSPLVITDNIFFETNGNKQDVDLVAWGQDAHFFVGDQVLEGLAYKYKVVAPEGESVLWEDDKPYVIYGWAVIDSAATLTIGPGVDVHFHQNSGLWVYRGGNIIVNGERDSVVTFQGDRLEPEYQNQSGQWDRIWINEGSVNNQFNYAVIKNGFIGLQAETLDADEDLVNALILRNTIVKNMSRWGLFTIAYAVVAENSIFANCAENTMILTVGGFYDFKHCTFANYWSGSIRQDPSFTLSNNLTYLNSEGQPVTVLGPLNAKFWNCIVYGNVDEELLFSEDEAVAFNYTFDHCLLKTEVNLDNDPHFINCIKNEDPLFVDYGVNNYRLDTLSPASDIGSLAAIDSAYFDVSVDLEGISRLADDGPDLGAYEFVPGGGQN